MHWFAETNTVKECVLMSTTSGTRMFILLAGWIGPRISSRLQLTLMYVTLRYHISTLTSVGTFLFIQRKDVVRALHAESKTESWIECSRNVHTTLIEQSNSSHTLLPRLLRKIPVLIFAGDQDLICNYMGLEAMMQSLTWNGETGFGVGSSVICPRSCSNS